MSIRNSILISFIAIFLSSCFFAVPPYKGEKSDHFDGENFHNLDRSDGFNYWDLMWFFISRTDGYWADFYPQNIPCNPPATTKDGELKVTFINHASTLIQFDGINVLTDPVWSEYTTPVKPIGPQRRRAPGIDFDKLPHIDVVVISHNHYDHMDFATLKMLKEKFDPIILYPLGNKPIFVDNELPNSRDMDWWDTLNIKGRTVTFVPARHFANRGAIDRNVTLWGGYMFETSEGPVYFAGDTGFGIHYQMLKEKYGAMRFSILPIAPIEPRFFMAEVHQDAREAVMAHKELESQKSMGIHFGTFKQASDAMRAPIDSLIVGLRDLDVSPADFILPGHGRIIDVKPLNKSKSKTNHNTTIKK
ncbi:MAG: MBL fold metallo-hydrolase [Candidatus Kapaibacterium sp.]